MKRILCFVILLLLSGQWLAASIRVVTYNVIASDGLRSNCSEMLSGIGNESVNGISRPIDILILQECDDNYFATEAAIVNILNTLYGPNKYTYSSLSTTGYMMRIGLVYNRDTIQLISNVAFKDSAPPRSTGRYQFRIIGYGPESDIYVYNDHYKAYSDASALVDRATEALSVRWDKYYGGDALPEGSNLIYAGDYNLLSPYDDAAMGSYDVTASGGPDNAWYYLVGLTYLPGPLGTKYTSTGNGRAIDPARFTSLTNWNTSSYKKWLTYNSTSPASRLDFQLISNELADGEGVSLIAPGVGNCQAVENSYHVFPNDGTYAWGGRLVDATNSKYDRMQRYYASVFSDHLPVVADYQTPAKMDVQVVMPADSIVMGSSAIASVTVTNTASATAPAGADELDYEIQILSGGTLIGSSTGVDQPLNGGQTHQVNLNTDTLGDYSLAVQVTSGSQGVVNGTYSNSFFYRVELGCSLLDFVSAWLSQPENWNWNSDCELSTVQDDIIDLNDFVIISQYWLSM
jgi:exonuclease III